MTGPVPRPAEAPVLPAWSGEPRRVSVLGSTGSVGCSTIDLLKRMPERFRVVALTANTNAALLAEQALALGAEIAAIADPSAFDELATRLAGSGIEAAAGSTAVIEAARRATDVTVAAIVGAAGLEPSLAALEAGATLALANKECLVCAGALFMRIAESRGSRILPVDSEHNAIFQALEGHNRDHVAEIVLTASGGPFRTRSREQLSGVTRAEALKHPNWSMGAKITIDSSTMMNKGLELIEAHHLFGFPAERFSVLVHPQSVVHGLVRYTDGSVLAQLGSPDMRTPIAHCLAFPARMPVPVRALDLASIGQLTFEPPDRDRFPCLRLAEVALAQGGGATNVLNAANEIAVSAFLQDRISWMRIAAVVEATLERCAVMGLAEGPDSLAAALDLDRTARHIAIEVVGHSYG